MQHAQEPELHFWFSHPCYHMPLWLQLAPMSSTGWGIEVGDWELAAATTVTLLIPLASPAMARHTEWFSWAAEIICGSLDPWAWRKIASSQQDPQEPLHGHPNYLR